VPTLAFCLGSRDLITDTRLLSPGANRHARSLELIKIFDEIFAAKDPRPEWRKILDVNGLVFRLVGSSRYPTTGQIIENEVCARFECGTILNRQQPDRDRGSQSPNRGIRPYRRAQD